MKETVYIIPNAPRLALLADLHNKPHPSIISSLKEHRPSLICVAGDVVYGPKPLSDQMNVLPFLRECSSVAPTFLSLGNHEQYLTRKEIRELRNTGVTVLDNEWKEIEVDGRRIFIGGLTSAYVTDRRKYGREKKGEHVPETQWLKKYAATPGYHILLSHHPTYITQIPKSVELVLAGHLHGSQWRYYSLRRKEWRGVFNPDEGWFPEHSKGVYGKMIISAGLSNTAKVPRFFNPTEIVYVNDGVLQ